ncbi:hypothetical protein EON67_11485 [archaeon]|nr:MAG: hypothetical protein EON67_11485 [archaeon]
MRNRAHAMWSCWCAPSTRWRPCFRTWLSWCSTRAKCWTPSVGAHPSTHMRVRVRARAAQRLPQTGPSHGCAVARTPFLYSRVTYVLIACRVAESNVESAHEYIKKGNEHLRSAIKAQKRTRKCLCCMLCVGIIIVLLLVAGLGSFFGGAFKSA